MNIEKSELIRNRSESFLMAPLALESLQLANPFQRGLNLLLSCLAAISRDIDLSDVTLVKQNPKQKDGEGCCEGSALATRT